MSVVHMAVLRHTSIKDLRESVHQQTTELVTGELNRCDDDWRAGLGSLRDALAELQRTCEAILSKSRTAPSEALAGFVEKLVENAAGTVNHVVERARIEAQAELSQAQALVTKAESELEVVRREVAMIRDRADAEHTLRVEAEAKSKELQIQQARTTTEHEAQLRRQQSELDARREECADLVRRIEALQSERQSLVATIGSVQRAIHRAMASVDPPPEGPGGHGAADATADPLTAVPAANPAPATRPVSGVSPGDSIALAPLTRPVDAPAHSDDATAAVTSPEAYLESLLALAETMYLEDVRQGLTPLEAVDRLTANLQHARETFRSQAGATQPGDRSMFDAAVMRLLDAKSTTDFGRHLGIAAYELFKAKAS